MLTRTPGIRRIKLSHYWPRNMASLQRHSQQIFLHGTRSVPCFSSKRASTSFELLRSWALRLAACLSEKIPDFQCLRQLRLELKSRRPNAEASLRTQDFCEDYYYQQHASGERAGLKCLFDGTVDRHTYYVCYGDRKDKYQEWCNRDREIGTNTTRVD